MSRRATWLPTLAVALLVTGCGFEVSTAPESLDGDRLAERANTQLEKQNPGLTPGDLTCKDVKYEEGATARCLRTVVFDDGRLVRIGATVTITDVEGDGRFDITIDDEAQEFGVTGRSVLDQLRQQYSRQYGVTATGSCPSYLRGRRGEQITCTLEAKGRELEVVVTVTGVDPETFETRYRYEAR